METRVCMVYEELAQEMEQGEAAEEEFSVKEARRGCYPGNYFSLLSWPDQAPFFMEEAEEGSYVRHGTWNTDVVLFRSCCHVAAQPSKCSEAEEGTRFTFHLLCRPFRALCAHAVKLQGPSSSHSPLVLWLPPLSSGTA